MLEMVLHDIQRQVERPTWFFVKTYTSFLFTPT